MWGVWIRDFFHFEINTNQKAEIILARKNIFMDFYDFPHKKTNFS